MLIQMPRGSSDQPGAQNAEECNAFEAALRRDLATAPVISYDSVLGGWMKRAIEFTLTFLSAPIWAPVMLIAAASAKLRHPAPVFVAHERIGYGGRAFKCHTLRINPPSAVIEQLRPSEAPPANDWNTIAQSAEDRRAKWRRAYERLPLLLSVLRGDMALVGPSPLAREELEPLKTAKRYYLSARPGVIGVSAVADADEEEAGQYKTYAIAWSLSTDALLMWDALRSLRQRGELWKPSFKIKRRPAVRVNGEQPVVRRRSSA